MEGSEHLRATHEQVPGGEAWPAVPAAPEHLHPELSDDERRAIELAIETARAEDREVDDDTARRITLQLYGGEDSALFGLASTGSLEDGRIGDELHALYQDHNPRGPGVGERARYIRLHWGGAQPRTKRLKPAGPVSGKAQAATRRTTTNTRNGLAGVLYHEVKELA